MTNLPNHIDPFEFLAFVNRRANLMHTYTYMEIQLNAYKETNPDKDIRESQDRIDILKEHYEFLYRLELAYNAIQKVNTDYLNQNLMLTYKYQQLSVENKRLEKELKTLKENFANQ